MSVSAVILTLNEEKNIVDCIAALQEWCDDIVVFDSLSKDRTRELANQAGARVFERKFDNYAAQRNAALNTVNYPGEWVLMVDADERWHAEIGKVILSAIANKQYVRTDIFHFQRKDIFLGRWLKHNIGKSTWFGRLLRRDNVWVEREINEEYHCRGEKTYLPGPRFIHYPFNNGVAFWIERHNRYSDMEAVRLLAERAQRLAVRDICAADPVLRRKALKQLLYRLPGRPLAMFGAIYFLKGGFLDGKAGFYYSVLRMMYEYMIDIKINEIADGKENVK